MNYDDPNRPCQGANLRPVERHLESHASGNAGKDGYTVIARRPRVTHMTEPVSPREADRIEEFHKSFSMVADYDD
jgi:hypothetical protein